MKNSKTIGKNITEHGNVDCTRAVPKGLALLKFSDYPRVVVSTTAKKLGIPFAKALLGWKGSRRFPKPDLGGIVVSKRSVAKLCASLTQKVEANRNKPIIERLTPAQQLNEELGMPKYSRTGRWLNAGLISQAEAERIAEKCRYRHEETNYDELLASGCDKETARLLMTRRVDPSDDAEMEESGGAQ